MPGKKEEKRGEIGGMSYGKIMTSMLIPKDSRTNPKRVLGGIAFLAFVCLFLFSALSRSCRQDAGQQEEQRTGRAPAVTETRQG